MYRGYNFGFVSSSVAVSAAANPGTDNLVAWLGLDEGSGTSVSDKTSNNNDFTITNGTFVSGKIGSNAVRLDGTGDYISSDSTLTIGSKVCSITFWMYWTDSGSGEKYLYELGNRWWQTDGSIALKWDQSNARFLAAMQDSTGGTKYLEVAFPEPSDGQWVYVTAVFNGTANSNAGEIKLYYDSVEQTPSSPLTNTKNQASDFTSSTLYIGANSTGGEAITIDLDTFAIFSDELTANEITWLYNSGSGRSYSDVSGVTDITREGSAVTTATSFSTPTNIDVNIPAVSTNDILILLVTSNDYSEPTASPPTDWNKIAEQDGTDSGHSTVAAYWKRASSSDTATTETWSSFYPYGESYYIWVGAYSGCTTTGSPVDAYGTAAAGYSGTWSVDVTTTVTNTMIVTISGSTQNRTHTWSDGTELVDTAYASSSASVSINEKLEATSGSKTRSATPSGATSYTQIAVALKP